MPFRLSSPPEPGLLPADIMLKDIIPIVPVLIVVLSACAVLLAEAFRRPDEHMPVSWLGVIGVVGGIITSVSLWGRNAVGFGVIVVDNYTFFFNVLLCGIGRLTPGWPAGRCCRAGR